MAARHSDRPAWVSRFVANGSSQVATQSATGQSTPHDSVSVVPAILSLQPLIPPAPTVQTSSIQTPPVQPEIAPAIEPSSVSASSVTGTASLVAGTCGADINAERYFLTRRDHLQCAAGRAHRVVHRECLSQRLAGDRQRAILCRSTREAERAAILKLQSFEHAIGSLGYGQDGSLDVTSPTDVHTWSLDDDVLDALVAARRTTHSTSIVSVKRGALKAGRPRWYTHRSAAFGRE